MAEFINIVDKIVDLKKGLQYDGDFVDSPLKLAYGFKKHPEDETKYFLTIDWSYKHQHSETEEVYFSIDLITAYQIDYQKSKTTFDNIYALILDSHARLKTHYEREVADTNFENLVLTDPEEDAFNDKVRKIVYQDIPELNLG